MLGDNAAGALRDYCDRYEEFLNLKETKSDQRKALYKELKSLNLPVKGIQKILADARKDQQKLSEGREELKSAGVLLGVTVHVGEVVDDGSDPYTADTTDLAQQRVAAIKRIDDEIDEIGEEMKGLLKEAKNEGFVSKLIPAVVKARRDPDKFHESNLIFSTYLKAVGVDPHQPEPEPQP